MIKAAHGISEELIEWRRDFHMHPEIGFDVQRTAGIVAAALEGMGYRVRSGVGKTGVVAELGSGNRVVAIRADMDALPILERNETEYASTLPGRMHACGHDAHTAMALGAAMLLSRQQLEGTVRFLFQPSEEAADDEGLSGAQRMAMEGAMDGVHFVIAQHVDPEMPAGRIGISPGATFGGVDSWYGVIMGVGGHGAHPDKTIDPFFLTAHVITALNGIVSRRLDPLKPAAVSIGSLHGGETENVIPESVRITGTLRFMEATVRELLHTEIRRAFDIATALGGGYQLRFETGGPPMANHPQVSKVIAQTAAELIGSGNVGPTPLSLGAEDFGSFLERAPGAMFTLGTQREGRPVFGLHHPEFDIDESALPIGTALLAETALRLLRADADGASASRASLAPLPGQAS